MILIIFNMLLKVINSYKNPKDCFYFKFNFYLSSGFKPATYRIRVMLFNQLEFCLFRVFFWINYTTKPTCTLDIMILRTLELLDQFEDHQWVNECRKKSFSDLYGSQSMKCRNVGRINRFNLCTETCITKKNTVPTFEMKLWAG